MLIAKIDDGQITVADYRSLFRSTSFPGSGPDAEWLTENNCMPVSMFREHNRETQRLVPCAPYIDGGTVYTVAVEDKTAEELAADAAAKGQALQADIVRQTQARLDAFAQTRHYDDIKSASDYAGCSVPRFDVEGTYCRDARAETWAKLYDMLAEVQAGTRPMPAGFADVEPELPPLVWPTP
jgi:hypothetical protein